MSTGAHVVDIQPRWLTIDQAATYTGYAVKTLYNLVSDREIPHVKKRGRLRFDRLELDDWMERDKIPAVDELLEEVIGR